MIRYYMVFDGRVQGVGFRYTAYTQAEKLGLTGWVRNMTNGMVDAQVQGEDSKISRFILSLQKPNHFIRVDDVSIKEIPVVDGEDRFRIRN